MRFDDHRGMLPSRLELLGSGLRSTLVRTKTTGVGKGRETLDLVVDRRAVAHRRLGALGNSGQ